MNLLVARSILFIGFIISVVLIYKFVPGPNKDEE